MDVYLRSYDNILIMEDLNSGVSKNCLNGFCNAISLKTLKRDPTCFKNLSCIDLFLTNPQQCFQQTCAIETAISDLHKMVVTVMKTQKAKTKSHSQARSQRGGGGEGVRTPPLPNLHKFILPKTGSMHVFDAML